MISSGNYGTAMQGGTAELLRQLRILEQ